MVDLPPELTEGVSEEFVELFKQLWDQQEDMSIAELEATLALMKRDSPQLVETTEYKIMTSILKARKIMEN